ncbi:hypothetical protein B0H10DRAFT_1963047 [Mycena sp. CBHHK59/15]|nr:hypothetical protein B0H10DRAFT_1963047 [Mycena sp. CBHHK59/15]
MSHGSTLPHVIKNVVKQGFKFDLTYEWTNASRSPGPSKASIVSAVRQTDQGNARTSRAILDLACRDRYTHTGGKSHGPGMLKSTCSRPNLAACACDAVWLSRERARPGSGTPASGINPLHTPALVTRLVAHCARHRKHAARRHGHSRLQQIEG